MANYDPYFPVFSPHHTGTSRNAAYERVSEDPSKWSLYEAVNRNRLDVVEKILSNPVNFDYQQIAGAFRLTGQRGYVEIGEFILNRTKISVDVHCPDGYTALVLASREGHDDMLEMLLRHGADPSRSIYRTRVSALHWTAVNGHTLCAEMLIKAGASVDALTLQQRTPLILASCYGFLDIIKLLLRADQGASISSADLNGMTALHMSVKEGYNVCTDYLISEGANIDAQNVDGYTPLLYAIEHNYEELAYRIIKAGVNLELYLFRSKTRAIHMALALERFEICQYLIDAECNLEATCDLSQTCCGSAILNGNIQPIHIVATSRNLEIFKSILEKIDTYNLLTPTCEGHSALTLAACYGSNEILETMLKFLTKESPNIKSNNFLFEISNAVLFASLRGRLTNVLKILQYCGSNLPTPRISIDNNTFFNQSRLTYELFDQLLPDDQTKLRKGKKKNNNSNKKILSKLIILDRCGAFTFQCWQLWCYFTIPIKSTARR